MSYEAIVCRLSDVRKMPNADRLKVASALGYQVIVDLSKEDGDLGILFREGGQLSHEICFENNLYSHKHLNKNKEKGGFFGDNRRVRSQKLRGEMSEGFWTDLNILSWAGDISKLKEGDQFDTFCGYKICQKYYTPATIKAMNANGNKKQTKKVDKFNFSMLLEHYNTKQVRDNIHRVPEGAVLWLTAKAHGTCMSAETKVRMADGSLKKIKRIIPGEYVLGFDHKSNKIISSKVIDSFVYPPAQDWYEVIGEKRGCGMGNSTFKIICTETHEFFTQDGYKQIRNCGLFDTVFLARKDFEPSYVAKQLILGKFVGDGSLTVRKRTAKLEFSHKKEHKEYLRFCANLLGNIDSSNIDKPYISGYGTKMYRGKTKECRTVFDLLTKYKNGLTEDIADELDFLGLAFLYMDDGSLAHSEVQRDRANFALCDYTIEEAKHIQLCLKKKGIESVVFKDKENYVRMRINADSADKFFFQIRKYIPEIMQYKLPENHRGFFDENLFVEKENKETYLLMEHKITSIKNLGKKRFANRYDITTTTNNFFAHDVLVHNSQRTGCIKVKKRLGGFKRWWNNNFKFLQFKDEQWAVVSGTRRTVMRPNKLYNDSFYQGTSFRQKIHEQLESLNLHKGETLYYEVVGQTDKNNFIMPPHNIEDKELRKTYGDKMIYKYGCKEGENKILIYRITHMTEDGEQIDLSWPQIVARCKQLGLETVVLLEGPIIYDGDKEKILKKLKILSSGPDPLDKSHIKEGVVVRVEHEDMWDALKYKSFWFTTLEGIRANDDGFIDLEDIS